MTQIWSLYRNGKWILYGRFPFGDKWSHPWKLTLGDLIKMAAENSRKYL